MLKFYTKILYYNFPCLLNCQIISILNKTCNLPTRKEKARKFALETSIVTYFICSLRFTYIYTSKVNESNRTKTTKRNPSPAAICLTKGRFGSSRGITPGIVPFTGERSRCPDLESNSGFHSVLDRYGLRHALCCGSNCHYTDGEDLQCHNAFSSL